MSGIRHFIVGANGAAKSRLRPWSIQNSAAIEELGSGKYHCHHFEPLVRTFDPSTYDIRLTHAKEKKRKMILTVHHLARSQSERIPWLCEELGIDYELKVYDRCPILAPPELKRLHPSESAPVITDGDITLAESGAIAEYILVKYGKGKLVVGPEAKNYADYLFWLHFATGTLQPSLSRNMFLRLAQVPADNQVMASTVSRREQAVGMLNERLKDNQWLAGTDFTAADVMTVTSLTTMRLWMPYSLEPYLNVLSYLKRVGEREGYQKAMAKGDAGFEPLLGAEAPKPLV